MNGRSSDFDYRSKLWHSRLMNQGPCDHSVSHVDRAGFLSGSWTTEKTALGTRVVCQSCGKFYGYLEKLKVPPVKVPPSPVAAPSAQEDTGSSFCSGQDAALPPSSSAAPQATPARKRQAIDFAELRRQVSISQVLELLRFQPAGRSGNQVRGPCPIHGSSSPKSRSFSANLEKNTYQCFAKSCRSKGNQLDLYVATSGLPIYEAALELCEKLGIDVPRKETRP